MKKRRRVDISLHPKSHLNGILQRQVKDKPAQALKRGVDSALRSMGHAASLPVQKGGRAIKNGLQNTRSRFLGDDDATQQEDLKYYKPQLNIAGLNDEQIELQNDLSDANSDNSRRKDNKRQGQKTTRNFPWQSKKALEKGNRSASLEQDIKEQPASSTQRRRIPALVIDHYHGKNR